MILTSRLGAVTGSVLIGLGVVLLVAGYPNEIALRPYYQCYNCEMPFDFVECEFCEGEGYIQYLVMVFIGWILVVTGIIVVFHFGSRLMTAKIMK